MNKNIDVQNLKSQEALDVKFFFECKLCELQEKYYEYQNMYNAIEKLPIIRNQMYEYENKIKKLEDENKKIRRENLLLEVKVFIRNNI